MEEYEIQKKTQDQEGPSEEEEEMAEPLARQVAAECLHHLMGKWDWSGENSSLIYINALESATVYMVHIYTT